MQDTASMTSTFHILGVSVQNPNVPYFYFRYTVNGAGFNLWVYDKFKNGDPSESVYNIPEICNVKWFEDHSRVNSSQMPMQPKLAESFSAIVIAVFYT